MTSSRKARSARARIAADNAPETRARLARPDGVARDRYLFYTACTRPLDRLYLVREAASDDGAPREPSPFWDEARGLFPENTHFKDLELNHELVYGDPQSVVSRDEVIRAYLGE